MVKTGARVEALRWILRLVGRVEMTAAPSAPRLETLPRGTAEHVMDLYRMLGGIQDAPRFAPGPWDVAYSDGLLLELDEDLHFHRYRGTTLDAPWAELLPWAVPYRQYVRDGERRAGTGGRRWTKPVCGAAVRPGRPGRCLRRIRVTAMEAAGPLRRHEGRGGCGRPGEAGENSIYDTVEDVVLNDVL